MATTPDPAAVSAARKPTRRQVFGVERWALYFAVEKHLPRRLRRILARFV